MSHSTANPAVADRSVVMLLDQAAEGLEQARLAGTAAERFACARLAALRAAAAVLATRGEPARRPGRARSRPLSVWVLLADVAPELGEWSGFFAVCASTRVITTRDADDMLRQTEQFLGLARAAAVLRPQARRRH